MVRIALVGDYAPRHHSHRELEAVRSLLGADVVAEWVATEGAAVGDLSEFDGIWLTPGTPYADEAAAYRAVTWARVGDVPFLGTCGGLQYAVVEYFRNVLGEVDASHAESDGLDDGNVIAPLACSLQGQERLVTPVPGTRFADLMDGRAVVGLHYCDYGPGAAQVERLESGGMAIEATAPDVPAEVLRLPSHRFFVLTLFQPQIGAVAGLPVHPLVLDFVRCARDYARAGSPRFTPRRRSA